MKISSASAVLPTTALQVPAQPGRGVALVGRAARRVEERPGVVAEARDRPDVDDVAGLLVDPALERIGLDRGDRVEPVVDAGGEVAGRADVDDRADDEDRDRREQQEVRDEPRPQAPAPGPGDAARRRHVRRTALRDRLVDLGQVERRGRGHVVRAEVLLGRGLQLAARLEVADRAVDGVRNAAGASVMLRSM